MRQIEEFGENTHQDHNKLITITGVSGCGKDFLISQMKNVGILPDSVPIISMGAELFSTLQDIYPHLQSRDDIKRLLSHEEVRAGVSRLCDRIINQQPAILNTHVVYRQADSLTFNPDVERHLNPASYVYVWSDPKNIASWRHSDKTRSRPDESIDDIALHQELAMKITRTIATFNGSSITIIWNREDNICDNIDALHEQLECLQMPSSIERTYPVQNRI